jgi:hypothetical protein
MLGIMLLLSQAALPLPPIQRLLTGLDALQLDPLPALLRLSTFGSRSVTGNDLVMFIRVA